MDDMTRRVHLHGWTVANVPGPARKWAGVIGNGRSNVSARLVWTNSETLGGSLDVHLGGCRLVENSHLPRPDHGLVGIEACTDAVACDSIISVPIRSATILQMFGFEDLDSTLDSTHSLYGDYYRFNDDGFGWSHPGCLFSVAAAFSQVVDDDDFS